MNTNKETNHEPGYKADEGKPRLDLVLGEFSKALWQVGCVGTFGADKYTDSGWKSVDNAIERYMSALLRHYFKYKSGEVFDEESHLHHLSHLAWNALAVLQLTLTTPYSDPIKWNHDTIREEDKDESRTCTTT